MSEQKNSISIAVLQETICNIREKMKTFITDDEFAPVKKIVYGLVGAILLSFIGGVITFIWKQ